MPIINRIAEFQDEMTEWRRHLHQHPELAFEEHQTARFVAEKLRSFGVDQVIEGLGKTGVVGLIHGNGSGKTIGLRADMDALPIHEKSGRPYSSLVDGKMHACGHDGHTAMLLGASKYLAETRRFAGTIAVVFQPAEEGAAGAKYMMEDARFPALDLKEIYGLHNWPDLPAGSFAMCKGPSMAACDEFEIRLEGQGGHAAMPHQTQDTILCGAAIVQSLQKVVARNISPLDSAVISVCVFQGGTATNVIPQEIILKGTVRCFKDELRQLCAREIKKTVDAQAAMFNLRAEIRHDFGYPATVNWDRAAEFGADIAASIAGEDKIDREPQPSMGSEDFAYFLEEIPGSYIWLGAGMEEGTAALHSPFYDFNDNILPLGATYWAELAQKALPAAQ